MTMKIKRARRTVVMHQQTDGGVFFDDGQDGGDPSVALALTREEWAAFGQPAYLHVEVMTEHADDPLTPGPDAVMGVQVPGSFNPHQVAMEGEQLSAPSTLSDDAEMPVVTTELRLQ